jgi:hypothetical protein
MRRALVFLLTLSVSAPTSSVFAAVSGQAHPGGSIAGSARNAAGRTVANTTVRLRDLATGQLAGATTANAAGEFSFVGLEAGQYAVEVVNAAGQIVGTSAAISLSAGAAVTGVAVAASAAAAAATGVVAGSFFASTAGIITVAAAGAAVAGVTVAANRTTASA